MSRTFVSTFSSYLAITVLGLACGAGKSLSAQDAKLATARPVLADVPAVIGAAMPHPLEPALKMAYEGRERLQREIRDYTGMLVKRERIDDELTEHQFMSFKIRNRQVVDSKVVTPMSVYLKFLKPRAIEGREAIWVEGRNNGKLVAHEGGYKNLMSIRLDPRGKIAMVGQKYPISEIGIENLIARLIEKGERDRKRDECEVKFFPQAKVADRPCTLIEVRHPHPRPHFDFHLAQIFIDHELNVPIRYAAYRWPENGTDDPLLDEEYTYTQIELNVGLEDKDFDPKNPAYKFK